MAIKPYICGKNTVKLPTSGCSDCDALEQRVKDIEAWIETPMDTEAIESRTPLECYVADDAIVCQAIVCSAKVACEEAPTCDESTLGTFVWRGVGTAEEAPN